MRTQFFICSVLSSFVLACGGAAEPIERHVDPMPSSMPAPAPAPMPEPMPQPNTLAVVNTCFADVSQLFISPCEATTWGANMLQGNLELNHERGYMNLPAGCYEMLAITSDGETRFGGQTTLDADDRVYFTTCGPEDLVTDLSYRGDLDRTYHSPTKEASLTVVNQCQWAVVAVKLAPCGTNRWRALPLDPNEIGLAIDAGDTYTIPDVPVGCFDIHIDFVGNQLPALSSEGDQIEGGINYRIPLCTQ